MINNTSLKELCPACKTNLTLIESTDISEEQSLGCWLLKKCLQCNDYPETKVVELHPPKLVYCKNCNNQQTYSQCQNSSCQDCPCYNCLKCYQIEDNNKENVDLGEVRENKVGYEPKVK